MSDTNFPSPLTGVNRDIPLPTDKAADGKSLVNLPPGTPSSSYQQFIEAYDTEKRGAFDVHVYYDQTNQDQTRYATELYERIRREFPELRIYKLWDRPIGPHPTAMFEVSVFTPAQFGALIPWLAVWRGPLPVLVHPNSVPADGETLDAAEVRDHTQRAIWLGEKQPLDLKVFA
ncbi:Dopa 4,5-dioxygenase [Cordyceps fumosorosea ARSEF 2679]|uniref:Dopa 4,5-dioxygenase n=1 Tax=Cordyceps fumosorosea (strain ARSEF 2679) TaxID=1081104 RepID=A0A167MSB6_CORFA|nr:Dopa 4,5-dioxygenase [Cordyceps fumosorosea ARSEF 2679]OAA54701.1 Dopa 4,5-dioxygenase [Cordyceps fumosorosea ARSEF 2679]